MNYELLNTQKYKNVFSLTSKHLSFYTRVFFIGLAKHVPGVVHNIVEIGYGEMLRAPGRGLNLKQNTQNSLLESL